MTHGLAALGLGLFVVIPATAAGATSAPSLPPVLTARGLAADAVPVLPAPAWSAAIGPTHLSSPVVADLLGNGVPDVITADLSGVVNIYNGQTGAELSGWPQQVQVVPGQATAVESSPTVADLDNNGQQEIIVTAGSLNVQNQNGGVVVFNANGTVRWRLQTLDVFDQWTGGGPDGYSNGVVSTPAVADVNGDGYPDIVFGGFDHRIYALDRFGHELPGFPYDSDDTIWDSPALYDEAGIGHADIFLGGDASPGGPCGNLSSAGVLRALRETPSGPVVLWQRCQHQIFQSSPAIGDLQGNGQMDVVIGTGVSTGGTEPDSNELSAFHLTDGSPVPGWPVALNGPIFGSPVIGHLTGSPVNDVAVTTCPQCMGQPGSSEVDAVSGSGAVLWQESPGLPDGFNNQLLSTPILVDVNGDGINDVVIGGVGELWTLNGPNGAPIFAPIELNRVEENSAAVANFGPRYGWRLVVQSSNPTMTSGQVDSIPLPVAPAVGPAWPQWRQSPNHVGVAYSAPSTTGYWEVASDGGIFSYGNASFLGSAGAEPLVAPVVAMNPTPDHGGYRMVAADGGIFTYGDAAFYGSAGGLPLARPIVGMATTADGRGYWEVAADGGIFTYGDAAYFGSMGGHQLTQPIVGMAATPDGGGYWEVAADGGIFTFGDAHFYGSAGSIALARPIVGMAAAPNGAGYLLIASDGGIFTYGDATFEGSMGGQHLNKPIVGVAMTPDGHGYYQVAADGGIFTFGDAVFNSSAGNMILNKPIVAVAPST